MGAYIHSIGTSVPKFRIPQHKVLKFMQKAHGLSGKAAKKLEVLYRATGIHTRYSVLQDYNQTENYTFFPNKSDLEPFPCTSARQKKYHQEALQLSTASAKKALGVTSPAEITHLITVSCTGLHAPGLDIGLVASLGLQRDVKRTCINFMGCYAAINALKVADAFCMSSKPANVLVVCTELCTLHFQKDRSEDNLLSNALFGDGSAAVLVSNRPVPGSLGMEYFYGTLEPSGENEMSWDIGNTGFEMKLSSYVPQIVRTGVTALLSKLKENISIDNIHYYAVHPGGKKILQELENVLQISAGDNAFSRKILRDYGNMSSPTLLFVLAEIMRSISPADAGKQLLALAFGPGLTLESMVLRIQET